MLQRLIGERVFDLEVCLLAVRSFGPDEEAAVVAEKTRNDSVVIELDIVEIASHRPLIGECHRFCVMRLCKSGRLIVMAGCAGLLVRKSVMDRDPWIDSGLRNRLLSEGPSSKHK